MVSICKSWFVYGLFACCLGNTQAEIVRADGEYLYGPETSQSAACKLAEDKAKVAALASIFGEAVSSEEQQFCNATTGKQSDSRCEFNRVAWSLVEGDIRSVMNLKKRIEPRGDATACLVSLDADVIIPSKRPDPNFDVKLRIKQNVYRVGDDLALTLESTEPAYLAIFNWLPNENNKVHRIAKPGSGNGSDLGLLVKNSEGRLSTEYALVASWSDLYKDEKRLYDEWLIVIATKKPLKWLNAYDLDDFKAKLREIPLDERRVLRRGYQLAR